MSLVTHSEPGLPKAGLGLWLHVSYWPPTPRLLAPRLCVPPVSPKERSGEQHCIIQRIAVPFQTYILKKTDTGNSCHCYNSVQGHLSTIEGNLQNPSIHHLENSLPP